MSKAVEAKKENLPAELSMEAWGSNEMSASDLVIPKILLMQPMSPQVIDGKAQTGDLFETANETILGNIVNKPLKFVPIHMYKKWIIKRKKKGERKFNFDSMEDVTASNESAKWDYMDGQDEMKRIYTRFFYVLLEGHKMPFVLAFKSTSANSGKQLATQMYSLNALNKLPPVAKTMELFGSIEKGQEGSYGVLKVRPVEDTSNEVMMEAFEWYKRIVKGAVKVDDSDIVEEESAHVPDMSDVETEY